MDSLKSIRHWTSVLQKMHCTKCLSYNFAISSKPKKNNETLGGDGSVGSWNYKTNRNEILVRGRVRFLQLLLMDFAMLEICMLSFQGQQIKYPYTSADQLFRPKQHLFRLMHGWCNTLIVGYSHLISMSAFSWFRKLKTVSFSYTIRDIWSSKYELWSNRCLNQRFWRSNHILKCILHF